MVSLYLGWAVPWHTADVLLGAGLWQLWQWSCPVWEPFGDSTQSAAVVCGCYPSWSACGGCSGGLCPKREAQPLSWAGWTGDREQWYSCTDWQGARTPGCRVDKARGGETMYPPQTRPLPPLYDGGPRPPLPVPCLSPTAVTVCQGWRGGGGGGRRGKDGGRSTPVMLHAHSSSPPESPTWRAPSSPSTVPGCR